MTKKTTTALEQLSLLGEDEEPTSDHPHAEGLTDTQLACRSGGHSYPDRHTAKWFVDHDRSIEVGRLLAVKVLHCSCGVVRRSWITVPGGHAWGSPKMDYSDAAGYLLPPGEERASRAQYRRAQVGRDLGTRVMNTYKRQVDKLRAGYSS